MDITLVLMELELAAVHKTQRKEKRKIGQYPAILTSYWSIRRTECRCEWVKINLLKIVAILKHLQMRHFMNDILYYVFLYIYLRLDLNKLRFRTIFSKDSIFVNNKNNNNNNNNYWSTLNVKFRFVSN